MAKTGTGIGVFENTEMADNALDALYKAGFNHEHIYVSKQHPSGGFLSGIKKVFTGEESTSDKNVADDLSSMGLSSEEAEYYEQEYEAGHPVIAVQESGREQEAANILRANGARAYNVQRGSGQTMRSSGANQADVDRSAMGTGTATGTGMGTGEVNRSANVTGADTGADVDRSGKSMGTGQTTRSVHGTGADMDQSGTGMGTGQTTRSADVTGTDVDRTGRGTGRKNRGVDPTQSSTTNTPGMRESGIPGRANDPDAEGARKVQLREEQLRAEKQRVQTGEVSLHKDVVAEQQSIDVPLMHEEVYIERHGVSEGTVDRDDVPIGKDETINVPLSAEQPRVSKETKVTGEVSIGKRAVEETEKISDTVKREEARVEQQGDARVREREGMQNDNIDDIPPDRKNKGRI